MIPPATLSRAIIAGATSITVTSSDGYPQGAPFDVLIDQELFHVIPNTQTHRWTVLCGVAGTRPVAHAQGAQVVHVLTTIDLPKPNI